ncbi:MAG: hypothetical protein WC457_01375 [Patescibacteria group bacterium]
MKLHHSHIVIPATVVAIGIFAYFGWDFYTQRMEVYAYNYPDTNVTSASASSAIPSAVTVSDSVQLASSVVKSAPVTTGIIGDAALYAAYKAYMYWVDKGVSGGDNKMKSAWLTKFDPYYSNNLANVRISYTSRFSNLGMTDCNHIYFGNKDIVNKIKSGSDLSRSQLRWLAHELTHTAQCKNFGGRKQYALHWFKQVKGVILNAIKNGSFSDILKDIFNAQSLAKYDNDMSMEAYADKHADAVVKKLMP